MCDCTHSHEPQNEGRKEQHRAANAVLELAHKIDAISPIDCLPAQPEKTVRLGSQVSGAHGFGYSL